MQINLYEAKTRLSERVEAASHGKTVVIAKAWRTLAKLGLSNNRAAPCASA